MPFSNESNDEEGIPSLPATALAVVIQRKPKTTQHLRLAVAAQVPRNRESADDKLQTTLQHYEFDDDSASFSHLDALLTRLAPVSVVHLACTEKAQLNNKSVAADRKAQEVIKILNKLANVVSTRAGLQADSSDSSQQTGSSDDLVHVHEVLPSLQQAGGVDSVLEHLLCETSWLVFRGAAHHSDLIRKSIQLLLVGQGRVDRSDATRHTVVWDKASVLGSHLVLDRTAAECIHLLPPPHKGAQLVVGGTTNNNSLFGILNHCHTPVGKRLLQTWLRQPLVRLDKILRRQSAVACLVEENPTGRDRLRDEGLNGMSNIDLDALAVRLGAMEGEIRSPTAALAALYKLYLLVTIQLPQLHGPLEELVQAENSQSDDTSLLKQNYQGLTRVRNELAKAQDLVEHVLDLDAACNGEYRIKGSFDERLGELEAELNQNEVEKEECHQAMNDVWHQVTGQANQVRLELNNSTNSVDWSFRLPKTNDAKVLDTQVEGITITRMLKNGVHFTNRELKQLEQARTDLLAEYDSRQADVVGQACSVAATYAPVLERCATLVSELDVIASLAYAAAFAPTSYCRPNMTDSDADGEGIVLRQARHPCVELQEGLDFIPNDVSLVFGESSFLLVTGPNMGGKSTYIRSVGAIITMAQIGSYVPCSEAKINVVHHILARVGAGDVQERGISTFMAEMLEASSILHKATKRSLIIVDELGRGTSTFDGYGLASAISSHVLETIGCMTVFATHFHELTSLEQEYDSVKNCHVSAASNPDTGGLTFLYNVEPGPCLQSFGIQVAEMAQVPPSVIRSAKRRARALEQFETRQANKSAKRVRTSSHEDDKNFREKFSAIPMDSMSSEEKKAAIRSLLAQ